MSAKKAKIVFSLYVTPFKINNFNDVTDETYTIKSYCENDFVNGMETSRVLFSDLQRKRERKLVLFYEDKFSLPFDYGKELRLQGLKYITNPHPSMLIASMSILSEKLLQSIGLPWYASILLPMEMIDGCYFSIQRNGLDERTLKMQPADYQPYSAAILVEHL